MIKIFSVFAFIASVTIAFGQVTLSGTVTNDKSQAVSGATIHLLNTNLGAMTNERGEFQIKQVLSGRYTLLISAVGYAGVQIAVDAGKQSAPITIKLGEVATQLEAVVVTAQKIEEDIQKVPLSISALSATQVQQYRLWNAKDITAIVPNLYSADPGDGRNVTSIRGITSTSYDPSVATYIDGVNQFGLDTYIAQLSDIERIEVLRGPQGSLYGRNAMGGVINIITRQPTNRASGFGEINLGSHGQQRYTVGLRAPVIKDKLFLGVSAMADRANGFYTNEFDQSHFDKKNSVMGNYYLKYLANSAWTFTFNLKHNQNRNDGTFPLAYSSPGYVPYTVNQNAVTTMVDNVLNASLSENYVGDKFNFSSQTTYQSNYRYYRKPIDGDFSPIDGVSIINDYGKDWNHVKVLTHELRFSSSASQVSPWQWTAGAWLFYQHNPVKQATHFGDDATYVDPSITDPNFSLVATSTGKSAGTAVFAQVSYRLTEQWSLTAGLRYDYEHKKQSVLGEYEKAPYPAFATRPDTSATSSFHALSPKVGLTFQPSEGSTIYLSYSRGFRAGGLTSVSSDPSQPPLFAYRPEYSNNAELGVKQSFLENRIRLNAALFYIRAIDVQVPTLVLPDAITVTRNAGELTSKGIEVEFSATPVRGLQVDYNFGVTDARYDRLKLSQYGNEMDLEGRRQLFTPRFTSMMAAQYTHSFGTSIDLKGMARLEWMQLGRQYFDLANSLEQSEYGLVNIRAGLTSKVVDVFLWVRNLRNKEYVSYAYDFGAVHMGDPRNWGITLRKGF